MLPFQVFFKAGVPAYGQVVYAVKKAVISGGLKPGDKFPSVRVLSQELRIHPNTAHKVVAARDPPAAERTSGRRGRAPGRGSQAAPARARGRPAGSETALEPPGPGEAMNNIIETRDLNRRFHKTDAVDVLNLAVPEGSIFAFLGPNGAGKTTTIKLLMNILRPTGGSATVLGTDSTRLGPREFSQIGYVSENQQMPEWMTVGQLIAFCRPMYPGWDTAFCDKLLKQFDLPLDRKLKALSRGMKVKAALLTSLAYRPRLLVLDEPFTGLDPLVRDEFIRGVLELSEERTWTVFISSHDIDEVERLADWVGVINAGRLQLAEAASSLQARFRRIECVLSATRLPATLPPSWLVPEMAGHRMMAVESRYQPEASEALLRGVFPDASQISVSPMSLRDIFLALARTFRLQASSPSSA
jgi:ABC-2 type transport system ATP-binding protein